MPGPYDIRGERGFDHLIAAVVTPPGGEDDGQHRELGQVQQAHHTGPADGGSGGRVFPVARHLHRRRRHLSGDRRRPSTLPRN
jgi:hypothetical protein